ncbi:MAG: hypothetical protein P4L83_06820 [Nevskia sp.]|nr:hypothetical protein [Nevskia sp.]
MFKHLPTLPTAGIPSLPLAGWLSALDHRSEHEILIGGTGHLLLHADEEEHIRTQLREEVLPRLFLKDAPVQACVLTGLAPGSDLLFAQVLSGWLLEHDIPFRIVGLLPVPPETLLDDWLHSLHAAGERVSPSQRMLQRRQIDITLASCETVVDLMPDSSTESDLYRRSFRQQQYRRLAACLAERSDILVAILRQQNPRKPGGTAEVVHWRRHPQRIPAEFCTTATPLTAAPGHRLIVIDPTVEYTPEKERTY